MRIRMLKQARGAHDGFTVRDYHVGTEHDLSESPRAVDLAHVFVREGWAEEIGARTPPAIAAAEAPNANAGPELAEAPADSAAAPTPPAAPDSMKRRGRGR